MTSIRPLERHDLPAVARLYQRAMAGVEAQAPPALVDALARGLLDHPWADPELPSLVCEDGSGRIVGFQGSHPRRLTLGDRPVAMVCGGQLVADPDSSPGIGALLMRRLLAGPQELTITDGATEAVEAMWNRLGGSTGGITCIGWTRVLRPGHLAAELWARRSRRLPARDWQHGRAPAAELADELTPELLIEQIARSRAELRPAYDERFLHWLFGELEAVRDRGPVARRVVRDQLGDVIGWYVAYLPRGRIAQVVGLGSLRSDPGPILDRLFADARAAGASAVQGRVDPGTLPALTNRRCIFRRTERALVHYRDDGIAIAAGREQVALTRLDGEWWMNYPALASRRTA